MAPEIGREGVRSFRLSIGANSSDSGMLSVSNNGLRGGLAAAATAGGERNGKQRTSRSDLGRTKGSGCVGCGLWIVAVDCVWTGGRRKDRAALEGASEQASVRGEPRMSVNHRGHEDGRRAWGFRFSAFSFSCLLPVAPAALLLAAAAASAALPALPGRAYHVGMGKPPVRSLPALASTVFPFCLCRPRFRRGPKRAEATTLTPQRAKSSRGATTKTHHRLSIMTTFRAKMRAQAWVRVGWRRVS